MFHLRTVLEAEGDDGSPNGLLLLVGPGAVEPVVTDGESGGELGDVEEMSGAAISAEGCAALAPCTLKRNTGECREGRGSISLQRFSPKHGPPTSARHAIRVGECLHPLLGVSCDVEQPAFV